MAVKKFGRYEIVSQLGRGAMGTVYKALDPAIERTVAIKTLNPDLPDESLPEVKARFLREAKSAGRLNHPNVVIIYDVGEADGVAYIAMEYLEGQSLRQLLDSGVPPLERTTDIVAQIADALTYAQRFHIVHRDIKPANIMLLPSGLAKLTDFGVAYMPSSSMTQTGSVLGSPKYMSPEQVLGLPVDGRADIFSLGVVLFEMLTRRTPFELPDITVYSLMQRICTEPAPRVTELNPEIPPAFDVILQRALAKRPEERYQNAADFARDLRNWRQVAGRAAEATLIASASPVDKTVFERAASAAPSPRAAEAEEQERMAKLLADLDAFTAKLEEEERRYAEQQARARAEAEARAKAEEEALRRVQEATSASRPRSALIGLLQEQAQAKAQRRAGQPALEQVLDLDAKMGRAFEYLAEFVRELNAASPAFAGSLTLVFVGTLPPMTLGAGFVDYRSKHFQDRQVVDYIQLFYRMSSEQRARVMLNPDEARILKAQLDRSEIKYEERAVALARHKVPHVALSIECSMPARATLQADYGALAVEFRCRNVGAIGQFKFRIGAGEFNMDAVEEFGKYLLGFPSRYAALRQPDLAGP
ncbi:MAG TPA: serine/threonine-protein kinase [Burkholderiales bacterium]|nr:serine/threonine-protein kinase [Burkholderiales bacterium]